MSKVGRKEKQHMNESPSILYVEDNATSRDVMEVLLNYVLGYNDVTIWDNSADFMERVCALRHKPNLILLDIHMQPIDGFAMLAALREDAEYRNITTVAVTASVMNEEIRLLKQAGFDGGIAKPIQQHIFPSLIERLLKGEKVWHIT